MIPRKHMRGLFCLVLVNILSACQSENPAPDITESIYTDAISAVIAAEDRLIAFRHDLHRNPEVSGEERRTSGKVASELERLGFTVRTNVGGYGVVGVIEGNKSGPVIAFRSDMDATRQPANDPVPYASQVEDVYHVCGHDLHTAIGIGLAESFAAVKDSLPGTVMLIFQPEEEAGTGADDMLADDIFSDIKPDAIFAVHTAPFETGQLFSKPNEMMAGRAAFNITVSGQGDIYAAASKVRETLFDLATVRPPEIYEFLQDDFLSVDVSPLPEKTTRKEITVRSYLMSANIERRPEVKSLAISAIEALEFKDIDIALDYSQALEGAYNNPKILDLANNAITTLTDDIAVKEVPGIVPAFSEDYGSFQKQVPGVMYFLGVNNSDLGTVGYPHTPDYVADDSAILVGVKSMTAAMLTMMNEDNL